MRYKATVDCHIFGAFRAAGAEFDGPELTGYDKETAGHLLVLDGMPSPPAQPIDLLKLNVAQLMTLAADNGVKIPPGTTKAQIVELLSAAASEDL